MGLKISSSKRVIDNDYQRFSNLSGGIQSLIIAVAVLIGGIWTAYIFVAQAELRSSRAALVKAEQEIKQSARLKLTQHHEILDIGNNTTVMKIQISITNHGDRSTILNWLRAAPLKIYKVDVRGGLIVKSGNPFMLYPQRIDQSKKIDSFMEKRISPGDEEILSFLFKPKNPGIYIATFTADGSELDKIEAMEARNMEYVDAAVWEVSDYLNYRTSSSQEINE